jgi:HKD family nuclease
LQSVYISVAFVTTSGVATIINKLKNYKIEITGQILVSQYLNFTQPEALKGYYNSKILIYVLLQLVTRMLKATFFKNNDHYNLIVGSSNLTALSTNKRWNIKVSALDDSGLVENVLGEFQTDFAKATPVTTDYIFSLR